MISSSVRQSNSLSMDWRKRMAICESSDVVPIGTSTRLMSSRRISRPFSSTGEP